MILTTNKIGRNLEIKKVNYIFDFELKKIPKH